MTFIRISFLLAIVLAASAFAQTGFTTKSFSLPGGQSRLLTADFNHDGRPDLLLLRGLHMSVMLNLGSGNFSAPAIVDSSLFNENAAIGDFNGDGVPDIVGCGTDTHENAHMRVYLNNGHGKFAISTSFLVADSECAPLVVGDVNHDGKADLVNGAIRTRFGNGAGHFTSTVTQAVNVNPRNHPSITGCFAVDMVGGHFVTSTTFDLLLTGTCNNPPGQPTIDFGTIFLARSQNNGHFTLSELREQDVTWQFTGPAIDVNNNGTPDALLVHRLNKINNAQVLYGLDYLRNNGGGSFGYFTTFTKDATNTPNNTFVFSGTAGDFDRDGSPDLAAAYELNGAFNIALIDDASGKFSVTQHFAVPGTVLSMISADFNHDGKPDFAALAINPDDTSTLFVYLKQ